ncbi:MAG: HNH endonuclease [Muribaculaceae bacterium]|nr:HNH endonuclease [Muribaculaceae bacterium]
MKKSNSYRILDITHYFPEIFPNTKKIDKRKNIFENSKGQKIYFQSSLVNDYNSYKATWNSIKWPILNLIDFYCLIVDKIGFFYIPIDLLKEYSYISPSKNDELFHIRFKIFPEMSFITSKGNTFNYSLKQYFIPFIFLDENKLEDQIAEESFEETLFKTLIFEDCKEQYKERLGFSRIRIENRAQKARIAKLENYTCQICGYRYEYKNNLGQKRWIIEVDHIKEKSKGGGEEINNMLVLCPNCHAKKTKGAIIINEDFSYLENNEIHQLKTNLHLGKFKHI